MYISLCHHNKQKQFSTESDHCIHFFEVCFITARAAWHPAPMVAAPIFVSITRRLREIALAPKNATPNSVFYLCPLQTRKLGVNNKFWIFDITILRMKKTAARALIHTT